MSSDQAVQEHEVTDTLAGGPLPLDDLFGRLGVADDPRWAALAMTRLEESGRIGFTGCDHGSNHGRSCVVSLMPDRNGEG